MMTWTKRRFLALAIVVAGVIWLLINKSVDEGPTLLVLGEGHGVTAADLPSFAAFVVAGLMWRRPRPD